MDSIEEPFLHFAIGEHREDIWHWFERQNPEFLVADAMHQAHRLIFSPSEAKANDGAGFWSNDDGWTVLKGATVFHKDQISDSMYAWRMNPIV